jgi:hypothetical protein
MKDTKVLVVEEGGVFIPRQKGGPMYVNLATWSGNKSILANRRARMFSYQHCT